VPSAAILCSAGNRPAAGQAAVYTEAVFSSSEDRIPATEAETVVGSPSVAFARGWSSQIAGSLFAVLFPSDCRICGQPLVKISRLPVCQDCLDEILPIDEGVCGLCGERLFSPYALAGSAGERRCGMCRRIEPVFARAVAYGSYEGGLRELIHLLKYGGVRPAANVLGRMLVEAIATLEADLPSGPVAVIPVPLHRSKRRQRGFNQAELIARAALKIAMHGRLRLCAAALERKRETTSQIGLTSHQRRANLRGAFAVVEPEEIKDREVLVVDDVYTTGATVSECARVLRRAGASKIWVATVARTLRISAHHAEISPDNESKMEEKDAAEAPLAKAVGM
jgi:ComF family protein